MLSFQRLPSRKPLRLLLHPQRHEESAKKVAPHFPLHRKTSEVSGFKVTTRLPLHSQTNAASVSKVAPRQIIHRLDRSRERPNRNSSSRPATIMSSGRHDWFSVRTDACSRLPRFAVVRSNSGRLPPDASYATSQVALTARWVCLHSWPSAATAG